MGPPPLHRRCPACSRLLGECKGRARSPPANFTLSLDWSLDAAVHYKVCEACYKRGTRAQGGSSHSDSVGLLLAAADLDLSTPRLQSLHPASSTLLPATLSASSPPSLLAPSVISPPLPLSDITNTPLKQRRHSTPLKRKQQLVEAAAALSSPEQRKQLCVREGVSDRALRRYAKAVKENERRLRPKQLLAEGANADGCHGKKRRPMSAERLSGGGRKPALTADQERWLRDWVLSLRRCDHHYAVAEIHIQLAARAKFGITAGDKWVQGFMERQGFSMRLRTTAKEVTTQAMQDIGFHWRNKFAPIFMHRHPHLLLNIDETSMYRDAPSNRTVDEVGAKTIEIGTTDHYKSRVAVLLCIDFQGRLLAPLVVYRCYEKKKLMKTHQFFKKTIITADGKPFDMWVTYARKAWLNGAIMAKWLQQVYHPHLQGTGQDISKSILFMDNCSAHKTEESMTFFSQAGVGYEFFPPHCTPILQPLDQTVNREFKREYEKEWAKWFQETGCFGRTPKGNRKAATNDEVNVWVANALSRVTAHMVRVSWEKSTCTPPHLLHLPDACWRRVLGCLPASQTVPLLPLLRRHRDYYSGSHFRCPVAVADRDKEEEEEEEKKEKETDTAAEDEETDIGEESEVQSWQWVQDVPLTSLYNEVLPPPGVPSWRLRLHPQALLIVR